MKGKHVKWLYLVCDLQFFFIASETVNTENKQQFPLSLLLQTVENDVKMFIAQVEQVSLQILNLLMSRLWYTRVQKMESCFLFIFKTMLAKFFKRPFTLVLAKVLRKWGVVERKKTVRYFHGLVKYCIRPRIRVFYESIQSLRRVQLWMSKQQFTQNFGAGIKVDNGGFETREFPLSE